MHEKYDVSQPGGGVGGGGEYAPQVGFGWSNGVALDLLAHHHAYCHSHQAGEGAEAAPADSSV
jgi:neutral trehalase